MREDISKWTYDKRLIAKYVKNSYNSTTQIIWFKNGHIWTDMFPKKAYRWPKTMEIHSMSLIIRELEQ